MVNRSAPNAAVVPILIYPDVAAAIEWLCDAFGFQERLRASGRDGIVGHAQLTSGGGDIMIGRAGGPFVAPERDRTHQYVLIAVDSVDSHFERARTRGARNRSAGRRHAVRHASLHGGRSDGTLVDVFAERCGCGSSGVGRRAQAFRSPRCFAMIIRCASDVP